MSGCMSAWVRGANELRGRACLRNQPILQFQLALRLFCYCHGRNTESCHRSTLSKTPLTVTAIPSSDASGTASVAHTHAPYERWKGGGVKAKGAKRPAIATRTWRRTAPPSMHQRHSRGAIGTRREPSVPSAQAALSMAGGQGACASNLLPRTCRQGTGRAPCSKDLPRLAGEGPNRRPKQAKNYRELLAGQVAHFT